MGYQIQGTYSNFFSLFLPVIDVEVAETATCFLAFWDTYLRSDLFFVGITLNVVQVLSLIPVFLCYLGGINPSGWRASLPIVLILYGGLGLKLISGRGTVRLSFFFVFTGSLIVRLLIGIFLVFLDQWAIALWAFRIDFPNIEGWLEVNFCLYISGLFHYFIACI